MKPKYMLCVVDNGDSKELHWYGAFGHGQKGIGSQIKYGYHHNWPSKGDVVEVWTYRSEFFTERRAKLLQEKYNIPEIIT